MGGFPCQDYSVAKTLNQAAGIQGKKGVLWWEIYRLLDLKRPRYVILENVDRLLKSPATRRGRDFAIILACLSDLGYAVEWRVVNAADYGFPQRRRRVFITAWQLEGDAPSGVDAIFTTGILARALPVKPIATERLFFDTLEISGDVHEVSDGFGLWTTTTPFRNAGFMVDRKVWTINTESKFRGRQRTLGDVLQPEDEIPSRFFVPDDQLPKWAYLKGAKKEARVNKRTGHKYNYTEGAIAYPDPLDTPSRTILTGEGGSTPSRFKHIIQTEDGRMRRLTPVELERLNGFPDDWTAEGVNGPIPDGRRAFMMGNALVVGIVKRIGKALAASTVDQRIDLEEDTARRA